jgi:hypothetical protein
MSRLQLVLLFAIFFAVSFAVSAIAVDEHETSTLETTQHFASPEGKPLHGKAFRYNLSAFDPLEYIISVAALIFKECRLTTPSYFVSSKE